MSDTRKEIEKTLTTEPLKLILQAILPAIGLSVLAWLGSITPYVRDYVWPAVPKVTLLVVAIFLVASNVVSIFLWLRSRRLLIDPELITFIDPPDIKQGAPIDDDPEITRVSFSSVPVELDRGEVRLQTDRGLSSTYTPRALTAKFHLGANLGSKAISLKSVISITSDDNNALYFIFNGVWLGNRTEYIKLQPGGLAELILGIEDGGCLRACEPEYVISGHGFRPILGNVATIRVQLIGLEGNAVDFSKTFVFRANLQPNIYINELELAKD